MVINYTIEINKNNEECKKVLENIESISIGGIFSDDCKRVYGDIRCNDSYCDADDFVKIVKELIEKVPNCEFSGEAEWVEADEFTELIYKFSYKAGELVDERVYPDPEEYGWDEEEWEEEWEE